MFDPLTDPRREFLARSLMDVVKFVVAAGLASGFYGAFAVPVRVAIGAVASGIFFLAWLLFPPKGGR